MSSSVIILIFSFWPFRHIANPVEFLEEISSPILQGFHGFAFKNSSMNFIENLDNGQWAYATLCVIWLVVYYIVNDYTTITLCIQWMYSFIFKVSTAFLDGAVYLLLRLIHCSMWILCIQWGGEIIFVEFPISYLRRTKANSICDD